MFPVKDLTDRFGRKHEYLRISLTERCNLRCFYCMPAEGIPLRDARHYMNRDEVSEFASLFCELGVNKIRLTGGEPLVRRDAWDIIESLSTLPAELAITTNGVLVDEFMDVFKRSRLRRINVSLDSLKPERLDRITRRNLSSRILDNIRLLISEGFTVKINMVVMRGENDDEISDFINWSANERVHVRFIEYMPFAGNRWEWKKGISFLEIMDQAYSRFGRENISKLADHENDTSRNFSVINGRGSFAVISSVTNPFCDTCNRIRLTADGKIKNCLFSGGETDLLTPFRSGADIRPLIIESVLQKEKIRGGMETFEKFADPLRNKMNRSMVAIGG